MYKENLILKIDLTNKVIKYCSEIDVFSFNLNSLLTLREVINKSNKIKECGLDLDNLQFHMNAVEIAWKNLSMYLDDDICGSQIKMFNVIARAKEALLKDQQILKRFSDATNVKDVKHFIITNLEHLELLYQIIF